MNLDNKVIFTTNENIKNALILKFEFKREQNMEYEIYSWKRETEESLDNLIFVYSKVDNLKETFSYIKENYLIQKFLLIWASDIVRNQDIDTWDIIIPNSFIDKKWDNPIFLEYAVWENFDLNKFWLILNWVCSENISGQEIINSDEFYSDIMDDDSYKFLSNLTQEEIEITVIIRLCLASEEDTQNNYFIENLLNIVDVMI